MNWYQFSKVSFIIVIVFLTQCLILLQAEDIVDSPIIKEVEQKKALYYNRKPPQGKNVVVVPKKPPPPVNVRKVVSPSPSPGTKRPINISSNGGTPTQRALPISKRGPGPLRVTGQPVQKENVRKTASSDAGKEQTASERTFFPPYKFPFWGMPYGIYSNGGFVNPGLFPFVPGGPGFPPYDGIFGSPFGPGLFPGKQNPIPPGVGTPMLPSGTAQSGQPPLNPSGNRRAPPPGAYSPGSPYGYRRPKTKPKGKTKPKPDPDDDSGCPCNKGKHEDTPPPPHRPHRKPKPTTAAPCPCSKPKPSKKPPPVEDYDDEDKHVCPYAHEPEPTQPPTTTPAYIHPPTYPPTPPPTPPPTAHTNEPSSPKPKSKLCKLKHKTKSVKPSYDYFSSSADDITTLEIIPPQPQTKKPCPLKAQKNVEYIYVMSPPAYLPEPTTTTTTTTTTTPSPPPPPPPIYTQAAYQQISQSSQQNPQPQQSDYQQNQQTATYQQNSQPPSPPSQQNPTPVTYQQNYSQQATYQQNSPLQPDQQKTQPASYQPTSQQTTYQQNSSPPSNPIQQNLQPTTYQQNSQPVTYVQQGTQTSNNQQQSVTNQLQMTPPHVVYTTNPQSATQSTASASQSTGSHNTILYKPVPNEIIQTPTSITVPLPLPPFMLDENGQLLQQTQQNPSQGGQKVTYKVDLNSDLLTKITTPVVIPQNRQANSVPMSISQNQQLQALLRQLTASNNQYIIENKPVTLATSGSRLAPMVSQVPQTQPQVYPQSRVLILDNLPAGVSQPSPITYSSQSVIQPSSSLSSVVVLKSEPTYDFLQTNSHPQQQQFPSAISYVQPQHYPAPVTSPYLAPSVQATPDYNFLVNNGPSLNLRNRHHYKTPATSNIPYPYRYAPAYDYHEEEYEVPYRRSPPPHDQSNYNTKDYVVIDREELDELKRTLISDSSYEEDDKNLPPPPDVVHIEYHPRMEDNREDFNKPLSFNGGGSNLNNHNNYYYERNAPSLNNQKYYDYSQYEREREQRFNPHKSMVSLFDSSKDTVTAEGSTQFSRVFNMNNEDIRGVGPPKKKKKSARGTLMVFDKYLQNSEDDEVEK